MTNLALLQPIPVPDPDSEPFWEGLKNGKLMLCRCDDTGKWIHPPLERSRYTGGPVHFEEVSGDGAIFSYVVVRQALVPGRMPPYVVGIIELAEQPRLRLSAIIAADPADIRIGQPVRLRIVDLGDSGYRVPEFVLTESQP
ncbi:MAG: Zn-ribbon domain-containing OB-fold protein [Mycobacterium sp.]